MITREEDNLSEKVELVKRITKDTLEALDVIESLIDGMQKKKATLKRDLNDLKEGRLDRIEERHRLDPESREFSAFTVEKKVVIGSKDISHWYAPYIISTIDTRIKKHEMGKEEATRVLLRHNFEIHNSITKINATGSYKLNSGKIAYL